LTPAETRRLANDSLEAVRSLVKSLRALKEQIEAVAKQSKARAEAGERQDKAPPTLHAELQLPEAIQSYCTSAQHSEPGKRRREWGLLAINSLTLLALVAYAGFTYHMQTAMVETVREAKRANNLNERLVKGTYAAILDLQPGFFNGTAMVEYLNKGKVISPFLEMKAVLVRKAIPSYESTGKPQALDFRREQIAADGIPVRANYPLDGFSEADGNLMSELRETVACASPEEMRAWGRSTSFSHVPTPWSS